MRLKWLNPDKMGVVSTNGTIHFMQELKMALPQFIQPDQLPFAYEAINNVLAMLYNHDDAAGWINVADALPLEHDTEMALKFFGTPRWKKDMWLTESNPVTVVVQWANGSVTTLPHIKLRDGSWILPMRGVTVVWWKPDSSAGTHESPRTSMADQKTQEPDE